MTVHTPQDSDGTHTTGDGTHTTCDGTTRTTGEVFDLVVRLIPLVYSTPCVLIRLQNEATRQDDHPNPSRNRQRFRSGFTQVQGSEDPSPTLLKQFQAYYGHHTRVTFDFLSQLEVTVAVFSSRISTPCLMRASACRGLDIAWSAQDALRCWACELVGLSQLGSSLVQSQQGTSQHH